jgi:hypothetical protein
MVQIIRGMSRKGPECETYFSACYESTERRSRNMSYAASCCSGQVSDFGGHKLADDLVREITARCGNAGLGLPIACAARSSPTGAAGCLKLVVQLYEIASNAASAVGVQLVLACGVGLRSLFGVIVMVTLVRAGNLAHQELSRVERVGLGPASGVLSKGVPTSASSNSAASLEARSAIDGWFVLRAPPAQVGASSTTSPIKVLRIVPGQ